MEVPPLSQTGRIRFNRSADHFAGRQALLGFSIGDCLSHSFAEFLSSEKIIHGVALGLITDD